MSLLYYFGSISLSQPAVLNLADDSVLKILRNTSFVLFICCTFKRRYQQLI